MTKANAVASYTFETEAYVQHFLDSLMPTEVFTVIALKDNGEQRKLTGHLNPDAPEGKRMQSVPLMVTHDVLHPDTVGKWRSFNRSKVLYISKGLY